MISVLISKQVYGEFGERIDGFLALRKLQASFCHLHHDVTAMTATDAPIDAALLTLDIRFDALRLDQFVSTISSSPQFRWLHFPGSGAMQHRWLPALMARGVRVSTSTGANAEPVALTAVMGLLMLARNAPHWIEARRNRSWSPLRENALPHDVRGQTALIIGLGAIGGHVARIAKSLGMRVIGMRRGPMRADDLVDAVEPPARLPELLPACDWVILTCPLTDETLHIIDTRALARMKRGAQLINVARGELVEEGALIAALKSGALAGAYLDVFEHEPIAPESQLWDLPNLIITPHNAAASRGNQWRMIEIFLENLDRFSHGAPLLNEVS